MGSGKAMCWGILKLRTPNQLYKMASTSILVFTVVICSILSSGNALMCYECNEFTSSDAQLGTLLAQSAAAGGQATCQSPNTTECTQPEGCQSTTITFYYTSNNGDFSVTTTSRGCGAPSTMCMDPNTVPGVIDGIRSGVESILTALGRQYTYSRYEGTMCSCNTGDLCNQGVPTTAAPDVTGRNNGATDMMETTTGSASSLIANLGLILVALSTLLAYKMF